MIFPEEQWKWSVDYSPLAYGFVNNCVNIYPLRRKAIVAYLTVPAEFFQLLDTILSDSFRAAAQAEGVEFYMDQLDEKHWVFGASTTGGAHEVDLWPYTTSTLPVWLDVAMRKK